MSEAIHDFQNAWIDRHLFGNGRGRLYRARRALRAHPNYVPQIERETVLLAERIAEQHRQWLYAATARH